MKKVNQIISLNFISKINELNIIKNLFLNQQFWIFKYLVFFLSFSITSFTSHAQFTQQGSKLIGIGAVGSAAQGNSISISSDGNTAIVGGGQDNGNIGAAWIFTRSGGAWSQQGTKLVGTGVVGNARQGESVSISGDGNTAIVGGPGDDGNQGAAWIYTRSEGIWSQQGPKLVGTVGVGILSFQSYSVSISHDGNTAIVGGNAFDGGIAWVFTRSGGVWTQQGPRLVGSGAIGLSNSEVSISADGNTAIVGVWADNLDKGAAWVFTRNGGVWIQQGPKLVGTGVAGDAHQGESVSISSDGNTAIVGGWNDNASKGAVWIFTRSAGVWNQQGPKLVGTGEVGNAGQGTSVSISDDGNTAIVGGRQDNGNIGAAWIFTRNGGTWTQRGFKLVGTGAVGNTLQGNSVSISGDGNTAIVGGDGDNNFRGAAWVYSYSNHPTINSLVCTNKIPNKNDHTFYSKDFPSSQNNLPIKVCADGSSASFFKINVSNPSGVGFRIFEGTNEVVNGTNSDDVSKYGKFSESVIFNGNFIEVNYSHPDHLSSGLFLDLTLQITYNEIPFTSFPLHIYRAPIVFIHGFIGESSTFVDMENKLLDDNLYPFLPFSPLIHRVNYFNESLKKFQSNRDVVPKGIDDVFAKARKQNFSAGRVIIIAHSMGGILSRLYLQSQYGVNYRNDIAKLITLNTPHRGTQFANWGKKHPFLLVPILSLYYSLDLIKLADAPNEFSIGAIWDMQVTSTETMEHLNISQNLQEKVPSATLSSNEIGDNNSATIAIKTIMKGQHLFIYKEDSDLIVPLSSQKGGILTNDPPFQKQWHVGSAKNSDIIFRVSQLIKINPASYLFTKTGFPKMDLDPPIFFQNHGIISNARSNSISDSIKIMSPNDSQLFSANQNVEVDIFSQGDISRMALIVYGASIEPIVFDTLAVDKLFFQIPDQAVGKLNLLLLGGNENEWLKSESISIFVSTNHPLDSLEVSPDTINLPLGTYTTINLKGYFNGSSNGINLSGVPDIIIQYNSNYLNKVNESTFYGKQVGSSDVLITYKGKTASVYINVFDDPSVLTASFNYSSDNICNNSYVSFGDESKGLATGYLWTFPGGSPATSTEKNPKVFYTQSGIFPVKIKTYFVNGIDSFELDNLIKVGNIGQGGSSCACTTPGTPTNISATVSDDNITLLTWSPGNPTGSPNVRYTWVVGTSPTVTYGLGISEGTTSNTGVSTNLIPPGGTYYLRVKAYTDCDNTSSEYGTSTAFNTVPCTTPGAPVHVQALVTGKTSANLSWQPGNPKGAPTLLYYWVIGTSPLVSYGNGVTQGITYSTNAVTSDLLAGTTYYLRVYATSNCNDILSPYGTSIAFTTNRNDNCFTPGNPLNVNAIPTGQNTANLSWASGTPSGSAAITYFWVIGTNPNVTYGSGVDQGFSSGTSAIISSLSCNSTYYLRVYGRTNCDNSISGYGTSTAFTTSDCSCMTPGNPLNVNAIPTGQNTANLSWASGTPSGSAAVTYFWVIGTNPNVTYGSGVDQGFSSGTSATTSSLSCNTTYYLRVYARTNCDNSISGYGTSTAFSTMACSCSTPGTPINLNAAVTGLNAANLSWNSGNPPGSPTVTYYWVVGSSNFVTLGNGVAQGSTTGFGATATGLLPGTTYYLRVYARTSCNGSVSGYGTSYAFTTNNAGCVTPSVQSSTITFSLVSTQQFTANWFNGNGSRRVVKINTVNNFSPPANGTDPLANSKYVGNGDQVVYNGNGNSVTITGLYPNTTYWIRVYEANCSGSSSFYNTSQGTNNPISQLTRTVLPSVQSFSASNVTFNGINIVDINPIFFTNQPYATHPPIDIFLQGNNKTRFTLNASYAEGFSFQLVDQLTIVTDATMAISPPTYGRLSPVISTSVNSMYMDYTHPEYVNVNPYLSLKIRLLFEGGLVGMDFPVHIHAPQGALPVELIDFRAQYNKHADINELSWITKSEVNNDYFDIERSFESFSFKNIGRVAGSGNSSTTIDYVFNDKNISQDGNYTYRLKQVDLNGRETFSKPASVNVFRSKSIKTGLFPNPASDLINCFVEAHEGAIVNIDIFNGLGQKVSRNVNSEIIGNMGLIRQIDSKDFGKGIFTVVFSIDGIRYNHKLIIID